MTKILFGQSYYLRFDPKLWDAMQPYPPLGTMYAASYLRARGYDVALFDAMLAESEEEWAQALDREQPRFAVIYEDNFNYLSKMCLLRMRQAAFTMTEMARARGCTVIICGSDATDHAEEYLAGGAQFVLLGEGEATLGELIDRLTGRTETRFEEILGLVWADVGHRTQDELSLHSKPSPFVVRRSSRRPDIKDLDALPFPAWDLIGVERYRRVWLERHGYYAMNMVTTRGCPYHCNWCAKPIWGQRYNVRSPENVAAEMKWLKETYQPDFIWFADDIVGLKPRWLSRFADAVEAQDAKLPFKCLSRVDLLLRDGDVDALRRAGCRVVWVGAESGSQKILDAMDKGTKVEQIYEAAQRLHDSGVQIGFFLQFGYPGETRADIAKTFQMVRDCKPDDIGMSVSYPLPGTKFHESVKLELGAKQNWVDSNDLEMLYRGPFTTAFYRQLHVVLHKEFRARKAWAALTNDKRRTTNDGSDRGRLPSPVFRHRLRLLATVVKNTLTWPVARLQLERLARAQHQGLAALPQRLAPEEAATPTPQSEVEQPVR
jgi:anaerobic magnesium-protoporphyrin IX monomethyl ester cyclase